MWERSGPPLARYPAPCFYSYSFSSYPLSAPLSSPASPLSLPPSLSPYLPTSLLSSTRSKLWSSYSFLTKACRMEFPAREEHTSFFLIHLRGVGVAFSISHYSIQVSSPPSRWELSMGCSGTPTHGGYLYPRQKKQNSSLG